MTTQQAAAPPSRTLRLTTLTEPEFETEYEDSALAAASLTITWLMLSTENPNGGYFRGTVS